MSMVILPNAKYGPIGQNTDMLRDILARIDTRLEELGLNESQAAKMAGLGIDGIRNVRRRVTGGKEDAGVSTTTLVKLAPVLQTTPSWLLDGTGPEQMPTGELRDILIKVQEARVPQELIDRITRIARLELADYTSRRDTAA